MYFRVGLRDSAFFSTKTPRKQIEFQRSTLMIPLAAKAQLSPSYSTISGLNVVVSTPILVTQKYKVWHLKIFEIDQQ